jgi:hypothetical protein
MKDWFRLERGHQTAFTGLVVGVDGVAICRMMAQAPSGRPCPMGIRGSCHLVEIERVLEGYGWSPVRILSGAAGSGGTLKAGQSTPNPVCDGS